MYMYINYSICSLLVITITKLDLKTTKLQLPLQYDVSQRIFSNEPINQLSTRAKKSPAQGQHRKSRSIPHEKKADHNKNSRISKPVSWLKSRLILRIIYIHKTNTQIPNRPKTKKKIKTLTYITATSPHREPKPIYDEQTNITQSKCVSR